MTTNIRTGLVDSIREHGYVGGPVVVNGGFNDILDGNHRYESAKAAGMTDDEIPSIDIRDIFDEAGLDYDELINDLAGDDADDIAVMNAEMDAMTYLPSDVMDQYELFNGNCGL